MIGDVRPHQEERVLGKRLSKQELVRLKKITKGTLLMVGGKLQSVQINDAMKGVLFLENRNTVNYEDVGDKNVAYMYVDSVANTNSDIENLADPPHKKGRMQTSTPKLKAKKSQQSSSNTCSVSDDSDKENNPNQSVANSASDDDSLNLVDPPPQKARMQKFTPKAKTKKTEQPAANSGNLTIPTPPKAKKQKPTPKGKAKIVQQSATVTKGKKTCKS